MQSSLLQSNKLAMLPHPVLHQPVGQQRQRRQLCDRCHLRMSSRQHAVWQVCANDQHRHSRE